MAITHSNQAKVSIGNAILDDIDGGTGAGKLKIYTTGQATLLSTHALTDPAGTVNGTTGVITFSAIGDATAVATGTAAEFTITDSDDNEIILGSVGQGSGDLDLTSTSITSGQTVSINTGGTYTPSP